MPFFEGIEENFRFLILEVTRQVKYSKECMENPASGRLDRAEARDDYVDNLKSAIEKKAFEKLQTIPPQEKKLIDQTRSFIGVANNLERIADFAVNIVSQTGYLKDNKFLLKYDYEPFFKDVLRALSLTEEALFKRDINIALEICRVEDKTDKIYKQLFDEILQELKSGNETENLVTALFIFRYLERMGDSLLNVGEAIIYATVGEKLKIDHFESVRDSFSNSMELEQGHSHRISNGGEDQSRGGDPFNMESMGETKSGSRIGRIHQRTPLGDERGAIYKEGRTKKILQERKNIETWESLVPGLPPKIFGFSGEEESSYLLLEFLEGTTIQGLILKNDEAALRTALESLFKTLRSVWTRTRMDQEVYAGYLEQLMVRSAEVFSVHPSFRKPHYILDLSESLTLQQMVEMMSPFEDQTPAPFSVFIHGDFNSDNVIYNRDTGRIHYIDLNRSRNSDYVQDVAVFIVSNFRMPFFEDKIRKRLDAASLDMFRFARAFAIEQGDESFEARLALALIRAFVTSTRFILHRDLSRAMYHRALYLMERLIHYSQTNDEIHTFKITEDIFRY